jgi:hypothetical protein
VWRWWRGWVSVEVSALRSLGGEEALKRGVKLGLLELYLDNSLMGKAGYVWEWPLWRKKLYREGFSQGAPFGALCLGVPGHRRHLASCPNVLCCRACLGDLL